MNTGEPDLRISYLEHRAMRMDANRLFDQVRRAEPKDDDRLRGISSWYVRYESAIHDHHTAEERVIYPALLERDESFADADGELEGEHRVLADRLTTVRQRLGALPSASGGGRWEAEREEALKAGVLDHATSSERAAVLAEQPLLLRLAYRLVLRPRYERRRAAATWHWLERRSDESVSRRGDLWQTAT